MAASASSPHCKADEHASGTESSLTHAARDLGSFPAGRPVLGNDGIGTIGALMNGDEAEEAFIFGQIDEVSIYDRTLTDDEVKQNNDTTTQASGVVAVDTAGKLALTWGGIKFSR